MNLTRRALLLVVGTIAALVALRAEPRNIQLAKEEIRTYVQSGEYLREMQAVAQQAAAWIEQRAGAARSADGAAKSERLAVVMDLDETLLANAEHILRLDFGYDRKAWDAWVHEAKAPAIEPVRQLYELARRLDVAVIFITGRGERYRAATEQNLRAVGCDGYARLVCRPDAWKDTSAVFKLGERQRLAAEGFVIIANLGDQESDLTGGGAERNFKFPNPFYLSK
ncbi:HAD family acid phosphatase [Opitutus terrae]|uniref:Acid phosphatase (Class B) n=1 Tax=Opitutus terrae (strain DSM 11246 / JCM 15787 / PB90-1) TaxID=452637 RepID=B1ZME0_OPITP|nr:HAD family acid phosphatase [Opitutus terrae]ACB73393.1 acid phosphatase (Class B) [Opitutus terrae PB90-1]